MAFEYLMTYYLLFGHLQKLTQNFAGLRELGYPDIPLRYQEAAAIFMSKSGSDVDLHGYELSRDVINSFHDFSELYKKKQGNIGADRQKYGTVVREYLFLLFRF